MKLGDIPITEIMTKEVVSVAPNQKLIDVKHIFEKKKFHHHVPVTENGMLKGMISLTDFLYAIKNASLDDNEVVYHTLLVKDVMREHPVSEPISSSLRDLTEILAKGDVHAVLICDKGVLKGIVSTADVIKYFLKNNN